MVRASSMVLVLSLVLACGDKKEPGARTDRPPAAGTAAPGSPPPPPPAPRGGDDAACTVALEKIVSLYRADNPDHAYASMLDRKTGEHYTTQWRLCARWWTDADRACIAAAANLEALERCPISVAAIEAARAVPGCAGGVVAKLDCGEGVWSNDRMCVPAPPGFTATVEGGDVTLAYPDGASLRLRAEADDAECEKSVRELVEEAHGSDETFDECRWPRGRYVAVDVRGDRGRYAKALVCSGGGSFSCGVGDAPRLEGACKGMQVLGPPEGALVPAGASSEATVPGKP